MSYGTRTYEARLGRRPYCTAHHPAPDRRPTRATLLALCVEPDGHKRCGDLCADGRRLRAEIDRVLDGI